MNVLQLAHRLPWPPIDGGKKGTLGFVLGYNRHPRVHGHEFLCLCPREEAHLATEWRLDGTRIGVDFIDAENRVLPFVANTLFGRLPYNMQKYVDGDFAGHIAEAIARNRPDVVHFDSLHTAHYAPQVQTAAPSAIRVIRCHNAEHMILTRMAETQTNPAKRAIFGIQADRLRSYEGSMMKHFDLILAITEEDAERFRTLDPQCADRILIIPAGADLPQSLPPAPSARSGPIHLMHIAAMDWLPNQIGLRWLLTEVIPRLDAAGFDYHLDIIGKNMSEEFSKFANPRITVHGFVADLEPILRRAHVGLVPLQIGGGMRVKILDYWASGIPVISTRVGAEGLSYGEPPVLGLADTAEAFADAIVRLGGDTALRETYRGRAFDRVNRDYGWSSIMDKVIVQYDHIIAARNTEPSDARARPN